MTREERISMLKAAVEVGDTMQVVADRHGASLPAVKDFCRRHIEGGFSKARSPVEEREQPQTRAPVPPAIPGGVPFMELQKRHCRAPVWGDEKGGGVDYRFCGGTQVEGSAYCAAHHDRMHLRPGQRTGERVGAMATMSTSVVRGRAA